MKEPSPAAIRFGELLRRHMDDGIREGKPGPLWAPKVFAGAIGKSPSAVYKWRSGRKLPSVSTLARIMKVLFGNSPAWETERRELQEAYAAAKSRSSRDRSGAATWNVLDGVQVRLWRIWLLRVAALLRDLARGGVFVQGAEDVQRFGVATIFTNPPFSSTFIG